MTRRAISGRPSRRDLSPPALREFLPVLDQLEPLLLETAGRGLHSFPFQLNLSSSVHRSTQINS